MSTVAARKPLSVRVDSIYPPEFNGIQGFAEMERKQLGDAIVWCRHVEAVVPQHPLTYVNGGTTARQPFVDRTEREKVLHVSYIHFLIVKLML